jgi:WD40 repeat protein
VICIFVTSPTPRGINTIATAASGIPVASSPPPPLPSVHPSAPFVLVVYADQCVIHFVHKFLKPVKQPVRLTACQRCRDTVATCAHDGSVRLWDVDRLKQKTVLKPTLRQSGRVAVTTCCYNSDGSIIAAGLVDGSIQLWDVKGAFLLRTSIRF